jgi:hypothetical protein
MLTAVSLEAVGGVAFEVVLLAVAGETVFATVLVEVAVAVEQAARAIMLIAMTILKIVFRFIKFSISKR